MFTRRIFMATSAATAAAGGATVLPYRAMADNHVSNSFETESGQIVVHPVSHASFVMETPTLTFYVDPVGEPSEYEGFAAPDVILVTHEHGDHYAPDLLGTLASSNTQLITNPAVYEMLPETLRANATALENGQSASIGDITIEAIPAYNITEDRLQYHPEGRDNGYVLGIDGRRVYVAGDTEDIDEMRALEGIDVAFLPMNLPYTMTVEQAASAVEAFAPTYVYPYHYRDSDPEAFASLVEESGAGSTVILGDWYGSGQG